ncbi:MAG: glycerophosphodiester phosphodiesterase [Legionellales bacterium RIFCSPHIGHO2_12_FULL_42_9]|nr:MAG: glycerophosphodiester phosphodiesterase [Legionellales bacterium RIFCSPHIGHO2_12_FULL_42_9]
MIIDFIENGVNTLFGLVPRTKPDECLLKQVKLIAHRGAHDHGQKIWENTHQAFERAHALGCWGIEFDVRSTADGVLVVHHDPTLKRLWGSPLAVSDLTYDALHVLAPEVATLDEVVGRYGGKLHLFIELKAPFDNELALCKTLDIVTPVTDYHLISLDGSLFERLSYFPRESLLLVPVYYNVSSFCKLSLTKQYGGVLGHYLLMNHRRIKRLRDAQQEFGVGFVDSKFSLYREVNRGIEWIFTNQATQIIRLLA